MFCGGRLYPRRCSCGTYAWCEEHEDSEVFYDHADHDCSPECCERHHAAESKSAAEIEASVSPIEISIKEIDPAEHLYNFAVNVRHKTEKEIFDELEYLLGCYNVEELCDKLKESVDLREPPLRPGDEVVITPSFLSPRTFALAVVRRGAPIRARVLETKDEWDCVCLLPEGVTLPGHSQPYQETENHCVVIARSSLTLIAPEELSCQPA